MSQNLAENFAGHRRFRAGADAIAELALDGAERALNVRPAMVMGHVLVLLELKVEERLGERSALSARRVALECDERLPVHVGDFLKILQRPIRLVRTDFVDREAAAGFADQRD